MALLPPLRGPPPSKREALGLLLLSQNFIFPLTKPPLLEGVGGESRFVEAKKKTSKTQGCINENFMIKCVQAVC